MNNQKMVADLNEDEHPKNLIPELLRLFYTLGLLKTLLFLGIYIGLYFGCFFLDWVTGTGGGITIKKELVNF